MKKVLAILCIALTITSLFILYYYRSSRLVPLVELTQPIQKTLNSKVYCTGTLKSNYTEYLSPQSGETIITLHKQSGERIEEGELLFTTISKAGEKAYVAPFTGAIGLSNLKEYTEIIPGFSFMQLISTDSLTVSASVDEIYLSDIRKGLPVELSLDAYPSRKYSGIISEITPYASASGGLAGWVLDQGSPSITVSIHISGDTSDLIPGLSASGEIITQTESNAILVPSRAVFMNDEGAYLFCFRNGIASKTPVTTGLYYDGYYQIKSGISATDLIITNPDDTLTDGMKVRPYA